MSIQIGDFVTAYGAGYWQLVDLKPKIADEDYSFESKHWKKGDIIGQWAILKKAFTPKMKPKIDFSYEDAAWLRPVSTEALTQIRQYFFEHPDYKLQFDNAELKIPPMVTNCWINLSEKEAGELKRIIEKMSDSFAMDAFWKKAKKYQKNVAASPPTSHLLNFLTYPWNMDKKANLLYFGCELNRV